MDGHAADFFRESCRAVECAVRDNHRACSSGNKAPCGPLASLPRAEDQGGPSGKIAEDFSREINRD